MERTRDRDRAALPEPMRRDVRLLGDILGEIIRDSGGPGAAGRRGAAPARGDRGAPAARQRTHAGRGRRRDRHAGRVLEPGAGRAGGPGLRRLLPPGQPGRGAPAHPQPAGTRHRPASRCGNRWPPPWPRSATTPGPEHLRELLASLRVHLVLTAHPTEARRRAVVAALRRISGLLDVLDDQRAAAADHAEARRELREQIDLLWRTSQLRVKAMDPIDEVRTVMTAFDETLFRVVPAVYRELDRAVAGTAGAGIAGAGLPAVRQLGGRRPGRQPVRDRAGHPGDRDDPGRSRAARAGERHHPDRPGADPARGDDAALGRAAPRAGRGARRAPGTAGRDRGALAAGAVPDLPALCGAADQRHPGPARRPGLPRARPSSSPTCAPSRSRWPRPGPAKQAHGELQHLIWQAETFGFHLAGLEVRQHSEVHARALAELRAAGLPGSEHSAGPPGAEPAAPLSAPTEEVLATFRAVAWVQDRYGVDACRRYVVSFTRSAADIAAVHELARYAMAGGRPARARRGAAVRERGRPGQRARRADRHARAARGRGAAGGQRPGARGDARLLRLGQGARPGQRHPAPVRHPGQAGRLGRGQRRPADPVPRPRRRPRPGRRPGRPGRAGPGARLGQRLVQGHRAGRGHLRPVRPAGHRQAAPGAGGLGRAARLVRADRRTDRRRRADLLRRRRPDRRGRLRRVPPPGRGGRLRRLVRPDQPAGRDRRPAHRLAPGQARPAPRRSDRRRPLRPPWTWPTCARSPGSSPGRRPG